MTTARGSDYMQFPNFHFPANPREYLHKPYTARNYVPWAIFLSLTVYG